MAETLYRPLMLLALVLTVAWLGWSAWEGLWAERPAGWNQYAAANRYFEDARYEKALAEYRAALAENPALLDARRGMARSLMQLGRYQEALALFDALIEAAPAFAPTYANRGILHDRMGQYEQALADYDHALALDAELADGANWLTRFLRNQPRMPSIADRADYLRRQLALPPAERVLRMPELDATQRPYKM